MLTVNIICIGKIKEKYWTDAIAEYRKRLSAFCRFNIIELAEEKDNGARIAAVLDTEGKRILGALSKNSYVVPMCIEGKMLSSPELAIARIRARVDAGGHFIPEETVRRRYYTGLKYFFDVYVPECDRWILADNSDPPFKIVAEGTRSAVSIKEPALYEHIREQETSSEIW